MWSRRGPRLVLLVCVFLLCASVIYAVSHTDAAPAAAPIVAAPQPPAAAASTPLEWAVVGLIAIGGVAAFFRPRRRMVSSKTNGD